MWIKSHFFLGSRKGKFKKRETFQSVRCSCLHSSERIASKRCLWHTSCQSGNVILIFSLVIVALFFPDVSLSRENKSHVKIAAAMINKAKNVCLGLLFLMDHTWLGWRLMIPLNWHFIERLCFKGLLIAASKHQQHFSSQLSISPTGAHLSFIMSWLHAMILFFLLHQHSQKTEFLGVWYCVF